MAAEREGARDGVASCPAPPDFHLRWQALGAPQRPCAAVVAAMRPWLADRRGPSLQLGVTPEIEHLSRHGIAIDWNADLIRLAWPGDSGTHRAMLGDWLALELDDASMATAFGDGCMSTLRWPDEHRRFVRELRRVLVPGGRLVLRCFVGPDDAEPIEAVARDAHAGAIRSFGAFKLRFAMAAFGADQAVDNSGERIHRLFERHVPDRARLAAASGWTAAQIANIDAYAGAASVHSYPTRGQIGAVLPVDARWRFVETTGYPLAERCPLLVLDLPAA